MPLLEKLKARWDGKTQVEIAEETGIDQATISRLISGYQTEIRGVTARRLIRAYPTLSNDVADYILSEHPKKAS